MRLRRLRPVVILALLAAGALLLPRAFPGVVLWAAKRVERGLAGLEERELVAAGHRIVYLEGGAGPTLLLLHGFAADKDNWTRLARRLTDRYHLVVPDLPGHGESDRLEDEPYDIRSQLARVRAFLDALGVERSHVAGNSMGGHLAAALAAEEPGRVARLILIDAGGVTSPERSELSLLLEQGENPLVASTPAEYDALLDFVFVEPPYVPDAILDHFAARAIEGRAFNEKMWAELFAAPYPLEDLLPAIASPTLILWGDSDRVLHPSSAAVFAAGLPDARTALLERCGHAPMIERPEEVAELVLDFLDP